MVAQAVRVLETITKHTSLSIELKSFDFGGIAIDNHGDPLPESTLSACKSADAILLGKSHLQKYKHSMMILISMMYRCDWGTQMGSRTRPT